jgi:hypothetical protein
MLDRTRDYNFPTALSITPPAPPAKMVDGHTFGRLTQSQKAAEGVLAMRGEVQLRPTIKAVAAAIGVSTTYVAKAARLMPRELHQLRTGAKTMQQLCAEDRFTALVRELGADRALNLLAAVEAA